MKLTSRYIPSGAHLTLGEEGKNAIYYYTTGAGQPALIAFHGKGGKPMAHYNFRDTDRREKYALEIMSKWENIEAWKEKRKAERNQPSKLEIGDILYSSWGYDQTNIDFYQVIAKTKSTVTIHEIMQVRTYEGHMHGTTMPVKDHFLTSEKPMVKRVTYGTNIKLNSYSWCGKWDGQPKSFSEWA